MHPYLDLARLGRNDWWRYLLAVLLILIFWQFLGAIPLALLLGWYLLDGDPATDLGAYGPTGDETSIFVASMLASVFFLAGIFLAVRYIHARPLRTLITPAPAPDWRRAGQGFLVWFVIVALLSLAEALLYPGRYVWTLDLRRFVPFVFLALILIPIQTSAEELFFRGYLLQWAGLRLRNIWLLSAFSGLVFGAMHTPNPEFQFNPLLLSIYYFLMGAVPAYVTLRDGRLELALGFHAANNLFAALFANYEVTVMPSPSLFTIQTQDVIFAVLATCLGLLAFVLIFVGPLGGQRRENAGAAGENG
ncbi:MAG: CPBP family intramembrane glutamic endopeptidase [Anaerolineales bacterium]